MAYAPRVRVRSPHRIMHAPIHTSHTYQRLIKGTLRRALLAALALRRQLLWRRAGAAASSSAACVASRDKRRELLLSPGFGSLVPTR